MALYLPLKESDNNMQHINTVKRITQYLMLGDFGSVQQYCNSHDIPEPILAWALAKIYRPLNAVQKSLLTEAMLAQYEGWQAYVSGDYKKSHAFFITAQHSNNEDSYGAGLGLAKVYTRLGHWEAAKQWLLSELPKARLYNDLYGQAQCYGALGELFLRANYPKQAYECFGNAFYLLPKGSSQREKQYNYQASALIRTGNIEQAEQCLMSALYLADNKQVDSVWHSLARLQFLWLQQNKNDSVQVCYADYLQEKPSIPVAEGFLCVASAFLAQRLHNNDQAIEQLSHALSCFKGSFPMEYNWTLKLLQVFKNEPMTLESLESVTPIWPENSLNLMESAWLKLRLPDQGFEAILKAQTIDDLWDNRLLFFI
jgi:tetratricopeptide (TPR) repeat protein